MFNVGRYDPAAQTNKQQQWKRKKDTKGLRSSEDHKKKKQQISNNVDDGAKNNKTATSLRVIAEEEKVPVVAKLLPEAIDDLDLLEDVIDDDVLPPPPNDDTDDADNVRADTSGDANQKSKSEIDAAMRISNDMSIEQAARGWRLAPFLVENLNRGGYEHFFLIQALVIPDVIASERHAHIRARDVCITAPTGSGKTLAYVLPILNSLATTSTICSPHRLRALVVLPSRDLATQVHSVFTSYVVGSHLKVGLAIGQSDFRAEQHALTVDEASTSTSMLLNRLAYDPGNLKLALQAFRGSSFHATATTSHSYPIPADGWSNVDVLVCTPGRLVDHLDNTAGFTLQHLRFLVIDEADRLLNQSYHNWINRVTESANSASIAAWRNLVHDKIPPLQLSADKASIIIEPITWRRGRTEGDTSDEYNTNDSVTAALICQPIQLRKFLVSATLTRDPQKLAALRLVNPKHFNVHQLQGEKNKYSMPSTLGEYTVECTAEQKPLVLLSLLLERRQRHQQEQQHRHEHHKSMVVIFTASLDSTHRLARLLQLLWCAQHYGHDVIGEFSSALNQTDRAALLKRCNNPDDGLSIIVCSDGMSRGMDIEYVDMVINYDVPTLAKTYVHRCGRTARASRKGTAISLLKGGQVSLFFRMRRLIQGSDRVQTMPVQKDLVRNAVGVYKMCVQALREVLDAEDNGELTHSDAIQDYVPDVH